ncbi:MAG: hypothetical protein ACYC1M_19055 [Armatimonadota bacterium]
MRVYPLNKKSTIAMLCILAISAAYLAYQKIPCYMAKQKHIEEMLSGQKSSIQSVVAGIRHFKIAEITRVDAGGVTIDLRSGEVVLNKPFPYIESVYKDLVKSRYQARQWMDAIPGKPNKTHYRLTKTYLSQLRKRLICALTLGQTSRPPTDWTQKCNPSLLVDLGYLDVQQITPPISISDQHRKLVFIFQEDRNDIKPPLIHTRWMKPWSRLPEGLISAYAQMGEICLDMYIMSGHLTYDPKAAKKAGMIE